MSGSFFAPNSRTMTTRMRMISGAPSLPNISLYLLTEAAGWVLSDRSDRCPTNRSGSDRNAQG
jgi:hypothetical protein